LVIGGLGNQIANADIERIFRLQCHRAVTACTGYVRRELASIEYIGHCILPKNPHKVDISLVVTSAINAQDVIKCLSSADI